MVLNQPVLLEFTLSLSELIVELESQFCPEEIMEFVVGLNKQMANVDFTIELRDRLNGFIEDENAREESLMNFTKALFDGSDN